MLQRKDIVFPDVDISGDEGDPEYDPADPMPEIPGKNSYRFVMPPGVHADAWQDIQWQWVAAAATYEEKPDDFANAWHYLNGHPMFWFFKQWEMPSRYPVNHVSALTADDGVNFGIDVIVVRVNPSTGHVDDDSALNTDTQVLLEAGEIGLFDKNYHWYDTGLDCGGYTYEEAIIELARLVHERYGNDRRCCDTTGISDEGHEKMAGP